MQILKRVGQYMFVNLAVRGLTVILAVSASSPASLKSLPEGASGSPPADASEFVLRRAIGICGRERIRRGVRGTSGAACDGHFAAIVPLPWRPPMASQMAHMQENGSQSEVGNQSSALPTLLFKI